MSNAAILFESEAYDTGRPQIAGRSSAGAGFLRGFARHAQVDTLWCHGADTRTFEHFVHLVTGLPPQPRRARFVPTTNPAGLAEPGCLFLPGPGLEKDTWIRRAIGQRRYSLCGLTHTICSERIYDTLGTYLTAPVQEWDALIVTSHPARRAIESLLAGWGEHLARCGNGGTFTAPLQMPVIPLGVDCDDFGRLADDQALRAAMRQRLGIGTDEVAVLFSGRLSFHAKANPVPMYLALERTAARCGRKLHLLHAGFFHNPSIGHEFRQAAARFCPSVTTHFITGDDDGLSKASAEALRAALAAADIFTSLSDNIQETFGLTPVEAMAAGLPLVVSDWDGYRDTVEHGTVGLRIPTLLPSAGSGEDLAMRHFAGVDGYDRYIGSVALATAVDVAACTDAYAALAADAHLRRTMGQAARARARAQYDWKVVVAAYQALWADLAERRAKAPERLAPRAGSNVNPLRPDPYSVFAGFASTTLDETMPLRLAPGDAARALDRLWQDTIATYAPAAILPRADLEALVAALPRDGSASAADLASVLPGRPRNLLLRSLAWLKKFAVLEFR